MIGRIVAHARENGRRGGYDVLRGCPLTGYSLKLARAKCGFIGWPWQGIGILKF